MIFKENLFKNKSFIITGASSGIGAHISLTLNKLGAKIIAIGRDKNKLLSQKKQAKNPDDFIIISKDLSNFENIDKWTLELAKEYEGFDGAVLAAGIAQPLGINSPYYTDSAKEIFNINYFGNLQILKGLINKKAKTKDEASFIWISSTASKTPGKGLSSYGASKAAINAAVKSIALEIAPKYRINSILPGFIKTPLTEIGFDSEPFENSYPLGIGKVENISPLVCFLLSNASSWITGQEIIIDGGGESL
ncbi:SDR family NAD(P)-dependent oxidoreductase [Campylobacter lari]|uniref:SDR family NAD(P)-dependent oxidoreductase n=1 Tax=Campylobacter TaxID=194 RepID=UPI0008B56D52|nr:MULTISPECIES: SDR family oxidoreductase [Campylobacter]MCV3388228.1 SDR family oxidoreductase [Campylobacter sp. IFREMER_LSEM_CL2256]MCV3461905.1 SDR family oxidoreductase [Campylobacter lari]MCV3497613.1 SDR family oxidoreductase [Campylobacter lari]MCV3534350.1 SDR family oxidoreductase [Campylobacter lari]QKF75840.1 short-chain dehydrogenase/reductase [Campylobacter lari subsp. lari]